MPIGFNSAARNLFLLGSSGAQVVTNFFKAIDKSAGSDGVYLPDEIKYNIIDQKYLLSGSASDSNSKSFGWFEKRDTGGNAEWEVRVEAGVGVNTTLRAMELDSNNNLIVVGKTGTVPWIAKYSNGGVIDWQTTTSSSDVEYTGITSDSNGNYYACGNTQASFEPPQVNIGLPASEAFVEKFDTNGNPSWGKTAVVLSRDVVLKKCAVNTRGEVVAVGHLEDDSAYKGYIVKIDTSTGEVLWDKTLKSYDHDLVLGYRATICEDVYIDSNDQIYVVGRLYGSSDSRSFIIKHSPEGNIIWQMETPNGENIEFYQVRSDGQTEQTVVLGRYTSASGLNSGIISKYSKDGTLVWRRLITSSVLDIFQKTNFGMSGYGGHVNLDADPSFYYLAFFDQEVDQIAGSPDRYTFGKVSTSGNGFGSFQYNDTTGETIDYVVSNIQDMTGRLFDGSVRQDSSDLITYPFSANKLLFDDYATHVSNKKRQMDAAGSFEYFGGPAIRPADFQELNLLGDVYSGSGNWLDQSGKGNDGIVNGATWNAAGYWQFDGVNDRILVDDDGRFQFADNGENFGIEAWVRRTGDGNAYTTIVSSWGQSTAIDNWIFSHNLGVLGFVWAPFSTGNYFLTGGSLTLNNWHHVVVTRDGTNFTMYVDGVQTASGTASGSYSSSLSYIEIGHYGSTSAGGGADSWFVGDIGEVRIYPRALTAAQVFQNYNATKETYTGVAASTDPGLTSTRTP